MDQTLLSLFFKKEEDKNDMAWSYFKITLKLPNTGHIHFFGPFTYMGQKMWFCFSSLKFFKFLNVFTFN